MHRNVRKFSENKIGPDHFAAVLREETKARCDEETEMNLGDARVVEELRETDVKTSFLYNLVYCIKCILSKVSSIKILYNAFL